MVTTKPSDDECSRNVADHNSLAAAAEMLLVGKTTSPEQEVTLDEDKQIAEKADKSKDDLYSDEDEKEDGETNVIDSTTQLPNDDSGISTDQDVSVKQGEEKKEEAECGGELSAASTN